MDFPIQLVDAFYIRTINRIRITKVSTHPPMHPSMHPSMHSTMHPSMHPSLAVTDTCPKLNERNSVYQSVYQARFRISLMSLRCFHLTVRMLHSLHVRLPLFPTTDSRPQTLPTHTTIAGLHTSLYLICTTAHFSTVTVSYTS